MMGLEEKIARALTIEERDYYTVEAQRLGTDWLHEAVVDEAHRRGFWAVLAVRELHPLVIQQIPISNEELAAALCRPAALGNSRSLILAFQVLARGVMDWKNLVEIARRERVVGVLKWLATRTVTPRTAALLFCLRGEPIVSLDMHPDRFLKPYLRPQPL